MKLKMQMRFMKFHLLVIMVMISFGKLHAQQKQIDIQGHRGARGLLPENTIPAFLRAIDEGVTTLELDVVISKDKQVVVSHEAYMSASICTKPGGEAVSKAEARQFNLYEMTYSQIAEFDCGSRGNGRFPNQEAMAVSKPLLKAMINAAEDYAREKGVAPLNYNIEIKSSAKGDGEFHPAVPEFSQLVHDVIEAELPKDRYTLQSFDFRVLQYWNEHYQDVSLVALIENTKSIDQNIEDLGFTPDVYSPYFKLLSEEKVVKIHSLGMKVVPWTVNTKKDMENLIKMGVDGIITDYPDIARTLKP
jgi:glycerophosphoryl diester phosphodiesterase